MNLLFLGVDQASCQMYGVYLRDFPDNLVPLVFGWCHILTCEISIIIPCI